MIFVDRVRACVPNRNWRWNESCHLYALPKNVESLHGFAARIGLKREWFQTGSKMPHYDLTRARRGKAVKRGAIEVDDRLMVEHMREWRSWELARVFVEWAEGMKSILPEFPAAWELAPYHAVPMEWYGKKYLVVPGHVLSRTDGDRHYVNAVELMRLYCVKPEECVIDGKFRIPSVVLSNLTVLRPRYDGDYPIFRKSNPTQQ